MSTKAQNTVVKKETVKKQNAKKKTAKKAARKRKLKPAVPAPQRMPETILPPPEELVDEYDELADDAETIMSEMSEYDDEDEAKEYLEGEIQAWHDEREAFFDRAELVWLELHPGTDPSCGDLDDWLGKKSLLMDL